VDLDAHELSLPMSPLRLTLLSLLLAVGCPKPPTPVPPPVASPTTAGSGAAVQGEEKADEIKPVYAGNAPVDHLAQRLCNLFNGLPAERQAACCKGGKLTVNFETECTRVVSLALSEKHLSLDAAKLAECEKAYKAQLDDCDRVMSLVSPPPDVCTDLFQGSLAAGAVCRSALECQKGLQCAGLGPTDPGHCALPAATGSPCHVIVDPLAVFAKQRVAEEHSVCAHYCNRNVCADFLPLGDACIFDTQCGPKARCQDKKCVAGGLVAGGGKCEHTSDCVRDALCEAGVCKTRGKTGEACTGDDQCLGQCEQTDGSGRCGPRCPRAFKPVFSQPQPAKK